MTQTVVLNQLAKFLKFCDKENTKDLRHSLRKYGHCHGFALCYAAMKLSNKSKWWQAALTTIANWDGDREALKKKIWLPDAANNAKIPLHDIFKRVLNYIVSHQMAHRNEGEKEFLPKNLHQKDILCKKSKYFTFQDENGSKSVKSSEQIAGNFTNDEINRLFDPKKLQKSICLVHSTVHTICVGYDNEEWWVHDPNYDHTSTETMCKSFADKNKFIKEVVRVLDSSFAVDVAVTDKNRKNFFPEYKKILTEKREDILKYFGLHLIAKYRADLFPKLIDTAKKTIEGRKLITCELQRNTPKNECGLHYVASFKPAGLKKVIKAAKKTGYGHAVVATAILEKDKYNETCLDTIFKYESKKIYLIADSNVLSSSVGDESCIQKIAAMNEGYFDALIKILMHEPHAYVNLVLNLIENENTKPETINKILKIKNASGVSGISILAQFASEKELIMVLNFTHSCNNDDRSKKKSAKNNHPILSHDQFFDTVDRYLYRKSSSSRIQLFNPSAASLDALLEINCTGDDATRHEIAKAFVDSHPEKGFAQELKKVLNPGRRHTQ